MDPSRRYSPDPYLDPYGSGLDIYRQIVKEQEAKKAQNELKASLWFALFVLALLFLV